MEKLSIDGLEREEARNKVIPLPRNQEFFVDSLSDGRKVFIRTDGTKQSLENGKKLDKIIDITIHYENEPKRKINYINDIFVSLIQIESTIGEDNMKILIKAIEDSINLVPLEKIKSKYPQIKEFEQINPSKHSIEFLLAIIKMLALQEDINYWGINPKTKKRYEGREKPINAIKDLFIKKMPLTHVTRKHRLY